MKNITSLYKSARQKLHPPGMLGAMLLMLGIFAYVWVLRPAQAQRDHIATEVSAQRIQATRPERAEERGDNPAQSLNEFYAFFPQANTTPEWLGAIQQAANKYGLQLEQGEYRATTQQLGKLVRYSVTLPVRGEYRQVRRFIAEVLNDMPHASLEGLNLQRQKITDPDVEAKIILALYLL